MNIEKLLNNKTPFICFSWWPAEKYIQFDCISEYAENCICFSERCGPLEDPDADLFELFYRPGFNNDGYLVDLDNYKNISDLMNNEYTMHIGEDNALFHPVNFQALPAGSYIAFKTE